MKRQILIILLLVQFGLVPPVSADVVAESTDWLPVSAVLGEILDYNVSFLWFKKIARGQIRFEQGEKDGTYIATLSAATRGTAAFFTRNRVETYTTLMEEGPDGLLRPLLQTSDTQKGKGSRVTHRITSYAFDFDAKQVIYSKAVNGNVEQTQRLSMDELTPVYDFLTAFYNLRLGRLGPVIPGSGIKLSAFSRKGPEEIVICRLFEEQQKLMDVSADLLLCKVLMAPGTFKTKGRDVYVAFDQQLRPQLAVIKNVIGLGDVRGELTRTSKISYLR